MEWLDAVNDILWHNYVLYTVLGTGVLFTLWSGIGQYRALTHGTAVIRGKYDRERDPGAITHFQALSAALSATVGLGNIAGVAIAVSLGGPGAVFWMWVTGFVGMALKMTEVTQAMLYRNVDDPANPHGGAMWVVSKGLARMSPALKPVGSALAVTFCITLLISTFTGGNMFQAWNVADITREYFGVPILVTGLIQTLIVGAVIVGGIKRIGTVAGRLVPFMCLTYLLAGVVVLIIEADQIPGLFGMIFSAAFSRQEAAGAFVGGAFGSAFLLGMRRALFSNEAGQGSSPIAHSAARTDQPVREGLVAGLEPFIDTLVVCTITALVILASGVWNRAPELAFASGQAPAGIVASERDPAGSRWTLEPCAVETREGNSLAEGQHVFAVVEAEHQAARDSRRYRLPGILRQQGNAFVVEWESRAGDEPPVVAVPGVYREYKGATLTARAFDQVIGGLGFALVPLAAWLFAISTMISWSYYGEQGAIYLFGARSVLPYRVIYCLLILAASSPLVRTEAELDTISSLGTGVMLFANIPIMLLFGRQAMRHYHDYVRQLKAGAFDR